MRLADLVDFELDRLRVGIFRERREPRVEVAQRRRLHLRRRAMVERIGDEVTEIGEGVIEPLVEFGMGLGRRAGRIALHEAPEQVLVVGRGDRDEVQQ